MTLSALANFNPAYSLLHCTTFKIPPLKDLAWRWQFFQSGCIFLSSVTHLTNSSHESQGQPARSFRYFQENKEGGILKFKERKVKKQYPYVSEKLIHKSNCLLLNYSNKILLSLSLSLSSLYITDKWMEMQNSPALYSKRQ